MQQMLAAAPDWLVPSLAMKAFSGLRTEEMLRIEWAHVKLDQDVIILTKQITKTKQLTHRAAPAEPEGMAGAAREGNWPYR